MSNYSKTTDFEAKDSLPTGDSGKIIRGAEFETEFDAISTAIGTKADTAGPTFTGTLTFETISDGTIGVTAFVDEDNMSSDSATLVPTQQSVKAYVDAQVTAQDLDFQADSGGALSIDLDSEALTFTGGTGVDTSGSGNAVTFAIDSTVATLTGTQTLTNKTLTSPDVNTPDIDGGTIDGTVIGGATPAAVSATTVSATGNITVGGTVDGRDVATDGTKLDGIEASATADQTAAEIRTLVGSASDSNVFTDADHSKLDGIEASATADQTAAEIRTLVESASDSNVFTDADHTKLNAIEASADVTDTANVTAAGALMDSELTSIASVKALNQGVATTDSPTFAGLTTTADVSFGDNDKAIFGAGSDLQIYHDGSNSYIVDNGTGDLLIRAENNLFLKRTNSDETYLSGAVNGAVTLFHNNNAKLETTLSGIDVTGSIVASGDLQLGSDAVASNINALGDVFVVNVDSNNNTGGTPNIQFKTSGNEKLRVSPSGIDVTGTVTADGLTVDGSGTITNTASTTTLTLAGNTGSVAGLRLQAEEVHADIFGVNEGVNYGGLKIQTNSNGTLKDRLKIESNGDISFYEDTGTTAKLFWDAAAESLGIGTSSPSNKLQIIGGTSGVDQINLASNLSDNTVKGAGIVMTMYTNNTAALIGGLAVNGATNLLFGSSGTDHRGIQNHIWYTNTNYNSTSGNTERMRLDSSGNLLVGKTAADNTTAGTRIHPAGYASFTIPNDYPIIANRLSSDGDIAVFRKDNTTIGSIGTDNGSLTVSSSASGKTGLYFASGGLLPMNSGALDGSDQVNIGSSSYQFKDLYLSGVVRLGTSTTYGTIEGKANSDLEIIANAGQVNGNPNIIFKSSNAGSSVAERMRITSAGDVEIKSGGELIANRADNARNIKLFNDNDFGTIQTSNDPIKIASQAYTRFDVGGTERVRIDSSGQLLLGRGADVAVGAEATRIQFYNTNSTYDIASIRSLIGAGQVNRGELSFAVNNGAGQQERMRLDYSGNLLVGTTSFTAGGGGHKLEPAGARASSRDATSSQYHNLFYNPNGLVGGITTSGSATTYNTSSDQRLKDNIVDAPSASDDIDAIQVRSFDWKADGSHQKYGMVAQELQTVAPEAVSAPEDPEDMLGVDYSKLVPMLVKEIQSLRARVAQLETN